MWVETCISKAVAPILGIQAQEGTRKSSFLGNEISVLLEHWCPIVYMLFLCPHDFSFEC